MLCESGGKREFEFPKSVGIKYGISYSTLTRSITELKNAGMINLVISGKSTRTKSLYAFMWAWKADNSQ